ncbi:MAG: hypothetical protein GTO02_10885 [Candidatus Dadabacteria bacterium]|nr:hypothetical protein [Candidatus Dadabacteria bacterium]NIQ14868.1 hypothetical protein [Candidatus Dadabacteria bacterium]
MGKKAFIFLISFLIFLQSSCIHLQNTNNYSSLRNGSVEEKLHSEDEITGQVVDKSETVEKKRKKNKWLWVIGTIILIAATITLIAIIDDDNGSSNGSGNGIHDPDDVVDDIFDDDIEF